MNNFTPGPPRASKPAPTVFCYICGRQFGSKSIAIHEPQCLRKWHLENEKLPKSKRRVAPVKPDAIIDHNGQIDQEATNEVLWKNSQGLMVECEHCERKFNEDRLAVHQRSCTAEKPAKSVIRDRSKSQPRK
ncbi:unnamed protein product [Caenorhabditis bovis]|uniref:C2HC/C3H-type domain-containing protein n=1 Tax=Caenorhabditis bovis TaxID=2654633 RepID=A0A8S1EHU1_9PELO|nr:unnamed protein product [Caenorhabditis bovis]